MCLGRPIEEAFFEVRVRVVSGAELLIDSRRDDVEILPPRKRVWPPFERQKYFKPHQSLLILILFSQWEMHLDV
jgi:hypothetical protein